MTSAMTTAVHAKRALQNINIYSKLIIYSCVFIQEPM